MLSSPAVDFGPALAVADAVLYEGYLLYPYRRSSVKNQVRWQFGVLAPRGWIEQGPEPADGVAGSSESWWSRTECLLEAELTARVELRLRFLQLVAGDDAEGFAEAIPQEVAAAATLEQLMSAGVEVPLHVPGGGDGHRRRQPVDAHLSVRADRVDAPFRLHKLSARVQSAAEGGGGETRAQVLRRSLVATHLLVGVDRGAFLSLLDPPEWARGAAEGCRNVRTFPVLAGPEGTTNLVLSAPIILYDHPQIAPESPGELFDGTEIDEILSLRTMTLTDDEKREARATDPRAAALVDRVDAMPTEILARLHGVVRSLRPVGEQSSEATPEAPAPAIGPDSVVVAGVPVTAGSRVRLRPRQRGADAQDLFVAGREATVVDVLTDVDGSQFLAVTVDGDPRSELAAGPGRLRHYSPDEVEPLGHSCAAAGGPAHGPSVPTQGRFCP